MRVIQPRSSVAAHRAFGRTVAVVVAALVLPLCASVAGAALLQSHVSWAIQHVPDPTGGSASFLSGVSCTSSSKCTAVGAATKSGHLVTLGERWQNQTWTPQATVSPAHSASSTLYAVACVGSNLCQAVGYASVGPGSTKTLVESWNGEHWSLETSPNPSGAIHSYLESIACPSATECVAVGYSATSKGRISSFAETWSGSSWASTVPAPSKSTGSALAATACKTKSNCMAVGHYYAASGATEALATQWNGSKWTLESVPGLTGTKGSGLDGVACSTTSVCNAVGTANKSGGRSVALAERWNGSKWTVQSVPDPVSAKDNVLNGVWCASVSSCIAVGGDTSGSTGAVLIEQLSGSTWKVVTAPAVKGSAKSALRWVACATAKACEVVGNQTNHATISSPLAERGGF